MSDPSFADLSIRDFLTTLASDAPTPGGGTGAALVGATGAALVRMLAVLTIGKPKYAAHDALMKAVAESADEARVRLLELADEDARSYDRVSAAYRLPKESPEEQGTRKAAIETALKGACETPMRIMEQCVEVIGLAKNAVPNGNRNAASDGAAGAEFARSAMVVAAYNVRINLVGIEDATYAKDMRTRLDEILYMGGAVASEIDSKVQDLWKPKPPPGGLPMFPGLGRPKT